MSMKESTPRKDSDQTTRSALLGLVKPRLLILTCVIVLSCALLVIAGCGKPSAATTKGSSDNKSTTSSGQTSAMPKEWSSSIDCTKCHAKEAKSASISSCLLSKHADMKCVTCHGDEAKLSEAHKAMTPAGATDLKRLKTTKIDSATVCTPCHDVTKLAEVTATSKILTDSKGTVVNPHALPQNDKHAKIQCTNCHQFHNEKYNMSGGANRVCGSCHHSGVYECGTCHE